MKKIITAIIMMSALSFLYAEQAELVYYEGDVSLKDLSGDEYYMEEGDTMSSGETVITEWDSLAELEIRNGNIITVKEDTIFTWMEGTGGEKDTGVLNVTAGAISCKFNKLLGANEPTLQTPSVVGGIRGTDFTLVTAMDGSSLITVTDGEVEITAEGKTVSIPKGKGVEVTMGEAPGELFELKGRADDYSAWQNEKQQDFLKNPVETLKKTGLGLGAFQKIINEMNPYIDEIKIGYESEKEKLEKLEGDAKQKYYDETVFPMKLKLNSLYLNRRHYALSAYSMRRYVMGRMYLTMKARYLNDLQNDSYMSFVKVYDYILSIYDEESAKYLNVTDV